jgi:hypothetical protein
MPAEDVQKLKNIAYINSQIASAYIELEAMKAANQERANHGLALVWPEAVFLSLIDKYQLGHNQVIANLNRGL